MYSKFILVALISVTVVASEQWPAAQFPAGVDPSKCPGFPICDNALLHNQQQQPSLDTPKPSRAHWDQPQPQWNSQPQHQWNPQPQAPQQQPQQQWNQPQPQWNQPQPSWNPAPYKAPSNQLAGGQLPNDQDQEEVFGPGGDKYPAGVNPQSCPNYPYCDGAASHNSAVAAPPPTTGYSEKQQQYPAGVSPHTCPNFPYCN